jgi:hypothetical protein
MCSGCHRVLNRREDPDGTQTWLHSAADYAAACPGGEPVDVDETVLLAVCDFCSTPVERHALMVRCEPFSYDLGPDTHYDDGQWAACEICADLIRAGAWDDLAEHAVYRYERLRGEFPEPWQRDAMKLSLSSLHAIVRAGMTGMVPT